MPPSLLPFPAVTAGFDVRTCATATAACMRPDITESDSGMPSAHVSGGKGGKGAGAAVASPAAAAAAAAPQGHGDKFLALLDGQYGKIVRARAMGDFLRDLGTCCTHCHRCRHARPSIPLLTLPPSRPSLPFTRAGGAYTLVLQDCETACTARVASLEKLAAALGK